MDHDVTFRSVCCRSSVRQEPSGWPCDLPDASRDPTSTIPIVFGVGADPVELGVVSNLARPGGNVTGVTILNRELMAKRLEILRELLPNETIVGLLVNPNKELAPDF
jgi:ABC-type uncharacterized transport system substrate-binding protein